VSELLRKAWLWFHPELEQVLDQKRRWTVTHTDCLVALRTLPDNCIDSCVCDPPAGISFAQKAWDSDKGGRDRWIDWLATIMREVYRVLKPGAHALIWSLPRTSYWTGMALDDAGFTVRDCLSHIFFTGYAKSKSVGEGLGTGLAPSHESWWLVRKQLDGTLAETLARWGTGSLRIDDCRVAHASAADLAAHQAQVDAIRTRGGSMANSWKNSSDLSGANDVNPAGRWPKHVLFSHAPACRRIGTKAVPANPTWDTPNRDTEPSAFTGKDVSAVRHSRAGEPSADRRYNGRGVSGFAALPGQRRDDVEDIEDWLCVESCPIRILETQSGPGAARYFQKFEEGALIPFRAQSKPSSGERDEGLGHFEPMTGGEATGRKDGSAGVNNPRAGAGRTGGRRNRHATVKSVALMRYLVRLVTPAGYGIVLDPFCGSGSTGIAAIEEGVYFVGMELNDTESEPFVRTARARIANAVGVDQHASPILSEDPRTGLKQLSLFAALGAK
jgi:site-specific DNA-methyltransferase (adenine-specific)